MAFDFEKDTCPCGKKHVAGIKAVYKGSGAIEKLPEAIRILGGTKVFVFGDMNTMRSAGHRVYRILEAENLPFSSYTYKTSPEPDETGVGTLVMHFDPSCDLIIAVGSGVINDIGKMLSVTKNCPYIIVATAPSMDGYASQSASMAVDGLKVSLPAKSADIIIGDTEILKTAPDKMLRAGLGDMLAKYISIGEWRLSHIITGEYYCENIAALIREAVEKCVQNAEALLRRENAAIEAVFDGLILGGIAMAYAGISRPASGIEHYFSHIWDMRALAFGTPASLHGMQCALGTLYASALYELLSALRPDKEKALRHAASFSYEKHAAFLRSFLGKGAEAMIALEKTEGKYNTEKHRKRLSVILENREALLEIIKTEIPKKSEILRILETAGFLNDPAFPQIEEALFKNTFLAAGDIRDKYVLPRLAWDLGITDALLEANDAKTV